MFITINTIVAIALAAVQFIYFEFILPNKTINVKATDTMRSINQVKMKFGIFLLTLYFVSIIFFEICILNELIIGVYTVDVIIFVLVGAPVIIDRIESRENILKKEE